MKKAKMHGTVAEAQDLVQPIKEAYMERFAKKMAQCRVPEPQDP